MSHKITTKQNLRECVGIFIMILLVFSLSNGAFAVSSSTGIIEPLYSDPFLADGSFYWKPLVDTKTQYPNVPFFAVVNPDDGPGSTPPTCSYDPNRLGNRTLDYQNGIDKLTNTGVIVLGYVDTINDTTGIQKSYSQVVHEIDTWVGCYQNVKGILLDDMQTWPFTSGNLTYYQNLTNYIHGDKKLTYSFGNPGTTTDQRFIGTVDAMNIFENGTLPQDAALAGTNNLHLQYDKSNFIFVSYHQPILPSAAWIREASLFVKYMFFTNYSLPNPWNGIPSYLSNETAALNTPSILLAINSVEQNGTSLFGPVIQIKHSNSLLRMAPTPFNYNTTRLTYEITADLCYGNWKFDYWESNHLHKIGNRSSPTIFILPASQTLTAHYKYVSSCNDVLHKSPHVFNPNHHRQGKN